MCLWLVITYLLTPWSRVLLEKLTSKLWLVITFIISYFLVQSL